MHKRALLHLSELRSITMWTALVLVAYPGRCAQGPLSCAGVSHHLMRTGTDGWSRSGMAICYSMPAGLPDRPHSIRVSLPPDKESSGRRRRALGLGVMRLLQMGDAVGQGRVLGSPAADTAPLSLPGTAGRLMWQGRAAPAVPPIGPPRARVRGVAGAATPRQSWFGGAARGKLEQLVVLAPRP
jgi:hypothetical protein